jgi:hypothetical protein
MLASGPLFWRSLTRITDELPSPADLERVQRGLETIE